MVCIAGFVAAPPRNHYSVSSMELGKVVGQFCNRQRSWGVRHCCQNVWNSLASLGNQGNHGQPHKPRQDFDVTMLGGLLGVGKNPAPGIQRSSIGRRNVFAPYPRSLGVRNVQRANTGRGGPYFPRAGDRLEPCAGGDDRAQRTMESAAGGE